MIPDGLSVTLVEPRYPVNLGHVARLMKNFGVGKLYLVDPKVDLSVAAVYASHASDVLDRAIVTTLRRVREENELLVATTAVRASARSNVIRRMAKPESLRELIEASASSSLVFGRDTTGMTNGEIGVCDVTTTIDTMPTYRALNLGHAVAILLYVVSRGRRKAPKQKQSRIARLTFAESFYELAVASGLQQHKVKNLREVGKRMAASALLTDRQLQMMTGVFRRGVQRIEEVHRPDSKT